MLKRNKIVDNKSNRKLFTQRNVGMYFTPKGCHSCITPGKKGKRRKDKENMIIQKTRAVGIYRQSNHWGSSTVHILNTMRTTQLHERIKERYQKKGQRGQDTSELTSAGGATRTCSYTCLSRWWRLAYRIRWFGLRHSRWVYFLVCLFLACWITFSLLNILSMALTTIKPFRYLLFTCWISLTLFRVDKTWFIQKGLSFIYIVPLLFMSSFKINQKKTSLGQNFSKNNNLY